MTCFCIPFMRYLRHALCHLVLAISATASDTLYYPEFLNIVLEEHPLTYRNSLLDDISEAYLLKARGLFDPQIMYNLKEKSFRSTDYYKLQEGGIHVPTATGIELGVEYRRNTGDFLDNSDILPGRGLINGNILIPLGKGLLYDQRRLEVDKAENIRRRNELVQRQNLNTLIFEASQAYIKWMAAREKVEVFSKSLDLNTHLLENILVGYETGELPAVDTLEADINRRNRLNKLIKAQMELELARREVNAYIWKEGMVPMELSEHVLPEKTPSLGLWDKTLSLIMADPEVFVQQHPRIQTIKIENANLDLERKWAREQLKPDLDLRWSPLILPGDGTDTPGFELDDYLLSVEFTYPILNRKARGKADLAKLRMKDNSILESNTHRQISVALQQNFNQLEALEERIQILDANIQAFEVLLQAEIDKFESGESAIFIINAREQQLLDLRSEKINVRRDMLITRLQTIFTAQAFI